MGSTLPDDVVERFDRDLAEILMADYPEVVEVPHRVFAVSGLKP